MNFSRILVIRSNSSSRAHKFREKYEREIREFSEEHHLEIREIFLEQIPFDRTCETISAIINSGDLVLAIGGDGTARAAIDSVMCAPDEVRENLTIAFLPLGNGNDFARTINRRARSFREIVSQQIREFSPLQLNINSGEKYIFTPSYATLGITTAAVDLLNQDFIREKRKKFAKFSPVAALSFRDLPELSRKINSLEIPDFSRKNRFYRDDSIGFFLVGAAHGLLPLRRFSRKRLFDNQEFFFHSSDIRGKFAGKTLFGKGIRAGGWTTFGLPGQRSTEEKLIFREKSNLTLNIGGDNIELKKVREISASRAERSVKIFAGRSEK
jgi:hypothetical protein